MAGLNRPPPGLRQWNADFDQTTSQSDSKPNNSRVQRPRNNQHRNNNNFTNRGGFTNNPPSTTVAATKKKQFSSDGERRPSAGAKSRQNWTGRPQGGIFTPSDMQRALAMTSSGPPPGFQGGIEEEGMVAQAKAPLLDRNVSVWCCVICCHDNDLFAITDCGHVVCYECATRIRVLGGRKECPICRRELTQVCIVEDPSKDIVSVQRPLRVKDRRAQEASLLFETQRGYDAFCDILSHVCTVCSNEPEFRNFADLKRHMSFVHDQHYCDICTEHLELFSFERKCYDRKQLATHKRSGDPDDTSHKGHPGCQFCDVRFLDNDHLYKHLRKDHYFCHFCDADGLIKFYNQYPELRDHFREQHFLCEEGDCAVEQFTSAFRSDIDLKAHKAKQHRSGSKRQDRVVNLEFQYNDRQQIRSRGGGARRPEQSRPEHFTGFGGQPARAINPTGAKIGTFDRLEVNNAASASTALGSHSDGEERGIAPPVVRNEKQGSDEFLAKPTDFPRLGGGQAASQAASNHHKSFKKPYTLRKKSESLDENEFPSLGGLNSRENTEPKDQPRANTMANKSVPKAKSARKILPSGLVMVDDDAEFPSFTAVNEFRTANGPLTLADHNTTSAVAGTVASVDVVDGIKETSLYESISSGKWGQKATNLSQAALMFKPSQHFPSLSEASSSGKPQKGTDNSRPQLQHNVWRKRERQQAIAHVAMQPNAVEHPEAGGFVLESSSWAAVKRKDQIKEQQEANKTPANNATKRPQDSDAVMISLLKSKTRQVTNNVDQKKSPPEKPNTSQNSRTNATKPKQQELMSAAPPGFESTSSEATPFRWTFVKPPQFQQRNRSLFDRIELILDSRDALDHFKWASGEFRRSLMSASDYVSAVRPLIGEREWTPVMQELISLLPDIDRQHALAQQIYGDAAAGARPKQAWKGAKSPIGGGTVDRIGPFYVCRICGQLSSNADRGQHSSAHHRDDEFPAL